MFKLFFLPLFLLFWLAGAWAQTDGLYEVTVAVEDHSTEAREAALQRALEQVLVRVSGDTGIMRAGAARDVTARARELVQRFGYEGDPEEELFLQTRFDSRAVNAALRDAGLPVWGGERPKTLVIVDQGDTDGIRQAAQARGIPVVFPSSADRRRLAAASEQQMLDTAAEYEASHLLAASVQGSGGNWRGNWRLLNNSTALDNWQSNASSLERLQSEALAHVADIYARQFAVRPGEGGGTVVLAINRVDGLQEYARVVNYLEKMTAVQLATPLRIAQDSVVLELKLAGSVDNFRRGMSLAGWLAEDALARESASYYSQGEALGYRIAN